MAILLENWSLCVRDFQPYQPPECQIQALHGKAINHPLHEAGSEITTGQVIGKVGYLVKTKSGSLYELGTIDPEYAALYPDARVRLFSTLPAME